MVFLLCELLRLSGGKVVRQQYEISQVVDFTSLENLILYGLVFECHVLDPKPFGTLDPRELRKTLARSKLFVRVSKENVISSTVVPDVPDWIMSSKMFLPIGFPDKYLV